jgi:hypothetical protein
MDRNYVITIKNNSLNDIYFQVSNNYPDTLLTLASSYLTIIHNNNSKTLDNPHKWADVFSEVFPKDTMLIFNSDTINKYNWETISHDYKIIQRRAYSQSDLQSANWTITYP